MKNVSQSNVSGKCVFCAIDLHDKKMLAGIANDTGRITYREFNTIEDEGVSDLTSMLHGLESKSGKREVWVSYEASGSGFRLHDILVEHGFRVSVLAPSHLPTSQKSRSQKTDKKDVKRIMDVLRAHVLAGADLPEVWVPDTELRDDREIVRHRVRLGDEVTKIKNKIHGLLKRNGLKKPEGVDNWSPAHFEWLKNVSESSPAGCGFALASLLRELDFYLSEKRAADRALKELSHRAEYEAQAEAMTSIKGVGLLTAMVFITELGYLGRFPNRRALASYIGLVPRSFESGEQNDRKGHISRLGPHRVRKLLNQASWVMVQHDPYWRDWFAERTPGNKKDDRKRMITAVMRRLAILMWHRGLDAAQAA